MSPSGTILLNQLHEQNTVETIGRARSQFHGSNEAFAELAEQYTSLAPRLRGKFLRMYGLSSEDSYFSQGTDLSLAVSAGMGHFLRNLVLSHRPARILELGSSVGVSTLYFADALCKLGRGTVVATELDSAKCARLREHVRMAGVESYVDLREGDVFQTVAELDGFFDFVFIDVWADTYLRLFRQIERLLRPGSIVLADNMYTAEDAVGTYKDYIEKNPGFSSTTLDFESGVEFTVVVS
ncbi:class I SAM-dependent methyltransferase [Paraburkholderia agricolaris]|jgi:predicted O-methyltransferase YrrM|uniref:Class I SAM-dependent methyltransferase n=1 Tax=Paraburkholderia agricolaris TaxID=2152888 RepID=A0ABW8ZMK0_9BURK|nr:class I SAM-dependent methyltransferase [Paraburkholderia agricolaris]